MSLAKDSIHIVTQAKGGVGKSFISRLLIQYLREHMNVFCFDADPLNDGLVSFKGLEAHKLDIKMINGNLDSRAYFDPLFETILLNDCCFLIDSGASTHINFINYIKGSDILNLFKENNREIFFHVPLAGNVDFHDCYKELLKLAKLFPHNKFVIWENEFHGELEENYDQDANYKELSNIIGAVKLKDLQSSPLLYDLELMNKKKLIFSEVDENQNYFGAIIRRRLELYKNSIYSQLDTVFDL
ncbi:hypothetical protein B9T31_16550 [Acinetobacter sp. ANC 4558]|uniref:nucleotide-binding protein n=1 Tax=Acinetobacter sp. ANC 4558 TaxID=1977876 RepID=UPI000A33DCE4|nr:hypothetical protein [Acinetobacter sp. ANC 4558]OTG79850.1 hypothetical protein B9T31_16550 [Acinetobacter sp. ANC 4558]